MTGDHQSLNTYYDTFEGAWGWRWGGGFGDATAPDNASKVRTPVVDVFDANGKTFNLARGNCGNWLLVAWDKGVGAIEPQAHGRSSNHLALHGSGTGSRG